MSKKLRKLVQGQDLFGHVINLNFDRQGDSHQTLIGGVFSLFVKTAMLVYVFTKFKQMFLYESDINFN